MRQKEYSFCFPAGEIQREERPTTVMIEKEGGEAKSFRKICHMAGAENKCGRDLHIIVMQEGVLSITAITTTEICGFHANFFHF